MNLIGVNSIMNKVVHNFYAASAREFSKNHSSDRSLLCAAVVVVVCFFYFAVVFVLYNDF